MQAANFILHRYEQLVTTFTRLYATHPDAEAYSPEFRPVLARCMAAKIAYGVTYEEDIELALKRLNQSRASALSTAPTDE